MNLVVQDTLANMPLGKGILPHIQLDAEKVSGKVNDLISGDTIQNAKTYIANFKFDGRVPGHQESGEIIAISTQLIESILTQNPDTNSHSEEIKQVLTDLLLIRVSESFSSEGWNLRFNSSDMLSEISIDLGLKTIEDLQKRLTDFIELLKNMGVSYKGIPYDKRNLAQNVLIKIESQLSKMNDSMYKYGILLNLIPTHERVQRRFEMTPDLSYKQMKTYAAELKKRLPEIIPSEDYDSWIFYIDAALKSFKYELREVKNPGNLRNKLIDRHQAGVRAVRQVGYYFGLRLPTATLIYLEKLFERKK